MSSVSYPALSTPLRPVACLACATCQSVIREIETHFFELRSAFATLRDHATYPSVWLLPQDQDVPQDPPVLRREEAFVSSQDNTLLSQTARLFTEEDDIEYEFPEEERHHDARGVRNAHRGRHNPRRAPGNG